MLFFQVKIKIDNWSYFKLGLQVRKGSCYFTQKSYSAYSEIVQCLSLHKKNLFLQYKKGKDISVPFCRAWELQHA